MDQPRGGVTRAELRNGQVAEGVRGTRRRPFDGGGNGWEGANMGSRKV
jgi:hypothetical protein